MNMTHVYTLASLIYLGENITTLDLEAMGIEPRCLAEAKLVASKSFNSRMLLEKMVSVVRANMIAEHLAAKTPA